jgi:hypothetical protein
MLRKLLTVTTPLLKVGNRLYIDFEDEILPVEVHSVVLDEDGEAEAIGVMADPDSESPYYAELYLEDYGHWCVCVYDD